MSEIRIIDLLESSDILDNDYIMIEQADGTKKAKASIINNKIKALDSKVDAIQYDFGKF